MSVNFVFASSSFSSWIQSDWSGGSAQTLWSDSTKFLSSENVSSTNSGIFLAENEDWFDLDWFYRQKIEIENNSASVLTDYQIPIFLNTSELIDAGKMQSDCADIRVVDSEKNILPIWVSTAPAINSCDGTNTKIWVKLSSLPEAGDNIYIYYGNSEANTVSDGNEVFPIFADFTSGSSLPSGWLKQDIGTSGSASVGSGVLSISNTNGEDVWQKVYGATHVYRNLAIDGGFIAETLLNSQYNSDPWAKTGITVQNSVNSGVGNGQVFIVATPGNGMAFQYQSQSGELCSYGSCEDGIIAPNLQINSGSASLPVFLKLSKNNSNQIAGFFSANGIDWTQRGSTVEPWGVTSTQYVSLFLTPHSTSKTGYATYSFFFVRKYTNSEPSVSLPQNEEKRYALSGSLTSSIFDFEVPVEFGDLIYFYTDATNTEIFVKVRTFDNLDMSDAIDFSLCDSRASDEDISENNCVSDRQRYAQYQVSISSDDGIFTPILDNFEIEYLNVPLYNLSYSALNGTISGSSTQAVYLGEDALEVSVIPSTGYYFTSWSDGVTSTDRTDLNVSENISVTANCATTTFSVNYNAGSGGTISGLAAQTVNYGDDSSTVEAIPNQGYSFINWSDGSEINPRKDTNVFNNISVNAIFSLNSNSSFIASSLPSIFVSQSFSSSSKSNLEVRNAYQMAISNSPDFSNAIWETYDEKFKNSQEKIYIKFRSIDGGVSDVYIIENYKNKNFDTTNINYEGKLVKYSNSPKIYKIENNKKRWIVDEETFNYYNFNFSDIYIVDIDFVEGQNIEIVKNNVKFTKDLSFGMIDEDVKKLQKYLNDSGFILVNEGIGSKGNETEYFGSLTQNALIKFQKANGINPALGYCGPLTRNILNKF